MSAPDVIYLQGEFDEDNWQEDLTEVTWCTDQVHDTDTEYCRITTQELARLRDQAADLPGMALVAHDMSALLMQGGLAPAPESLRERYEKALKAANINVDGADRIVAERIRQQTVEGFNAKHDEQHDMGELAQAAAAYLLHYLIDHREITIITADEAGLFWPWEPERWKPRGDISLLTKAGALIAAEIDRLRALEGARDGD